MPLIDLVQTIRQDLALRPGKRSLKLAWLDSRERSPILKRASLFWLWSRYDSLDPHSHEASRILWELARRRI